MAIIHPRISHPLALQHGGYQLELKLLEILRMGLPDNFDVFHGLTWSTVHNAMQKFGELDLTVVSPQGQILILEVKAGSVYTQNGWPSARCATQTIKASQYGPRGGSVFFGDARPNFAE